MSRIAVLPGDGIGPEVIRAALEVFRAVRERFGLEAEVEEAAIGGEALDACGDPLPKATLDLCKSSLAVLMGAVGGPKWDNAARRPEQGLLALRKELGLFANLRPVAVYPDLAHLSCLRPDLVAGGLDILVVRELTGDVYFGRPAGIEARAGERVGYSTMIYSESEIRRIARVAFEAARGRRGLVTSVDKANVLAVSRLWRSVVEETRVEYPDVRLEHMYVDNAAMQLISAPAHFDVILTGNLFGDILSDAGAALTGSLGMLPSASLAGFSNGASFGLYEPVHGSAPDLAGRDKANPLATILSLAMLLRLSLGRPAAALAVEKAVGATLRDGVKSADLYAPGDPAGTSAAGCRRITEAVIERLRG